MMQRYAALIGLMVVLACSNTTGPPKTHDNPLDTSKVGSSGGMVETSEVTLIIPPGAFASENTVRIYVSTEPNISQHQVTKTYEISGLPQDFSRPLHLRMKYTGALSEESLSLLAGAFFSTSLTRKGAFTHIFPLPIHPDI